MLLCQPVYWNTESQNSQDATCSIYALWETWLKRKRKTAMLYFHCQLSCEVWRGGRGWEQETDRQRRGEWFSSSTDPILMVTGDWAHPHLPTLYTSILSSPSDACHCSSFSPPSVLLTGRVCEVSPERHRLKDGIYKIHTEPTFNCLWRSSPAAFDVPT